MPAEPGSLHDPAVAGQAVLEFRGLPEYLRGKIGWPFRVEVTLADGLPVVWLSGHVLELVDDSDPAFPVARVEVAAKVAVPGPDDLWEVHIPPEGG